MSVLQGLPAPSSLVLTIAVASLCLVSYGVLLLLRRPRLSDRAPPLTAGGGRLIWGAGFDFFRARWEFHANARAQSRTGNFSYYVGPHPVVGVSGEASRKVFFESKELSFTEGYTTLFGGGAEIRKDAISHANEENAEVGSGFGAYFNKRLIAMLKGNRIRNGLPKLLRDVRSNLDALAAQKEGITDPFDSIYRIVFHLTMRTVASNEIADDPVLLAKCLSSFEAIEDSSTALGVMFPWLPTASKAKRTLAGGRMYMVFKNIIDERKKHNRSEDDALQYLLDQGDNVTDIITFVLGSLFAGQLNSGINAAYLLCFLARERQWYEEVCKEIDSVADKYAADKSQPLRERLMLVPSEAWEGEFPIIDLCLKETIRFNLPGTAFRQNLSGHDIPLNKAGSEVIPNGAYVTLASGDTFYSNDIFENADQWDPSRYLAPRCEDKKEAMAWYGWGAGRHPCLGMRFAKLEMSTIVAFFIAYFDDFSICDKAGNKTSYIPLGDRNNLSARKPAENIYIKYRVRA